MEVGSSRDDREREGGRERTELAMGCVSAGPMHALLQLKCRVLGRLTLS